MMEKQEEDRKEIARELHDNLGQKLNAVSMFVSKISDSIPDNNPEGIKDTINWYKRQNELGHIEKN